MSDQYHRLSLLELPERNAYPSCVLNLQRFQGQPMMQFASFGIIAMLEFYAYWPALISDFLCDDDLLLTRNPLIAGERHSSRCSCTTAPWPLDGFI
jgi:hypothetical protein